MFRTHVDEVNVESIDLRAASAETPWWVVVC
jgi:hypothetical protein